MERFGDDREVGELGHGRDCSRENLCARLSRPREAGQLKKRSSGHFEREGADRGNNGTTDHLIVTGHGLRALRPFVILGSTLDQE